MTGQFIIGLTGQRGSGKDSVGARLVERHGFTRVAFADALKDIATVIGWNGDKSDQEPCSTCGMLQGRELLQQLGAEGVRDHIAEDAWVTAAFRRIPAGVSNVVITDVRFLNEAAAIDLHGGALWRVVRPGYDGDAHASEREQAKIHCDYRIDNSGDLDALNDSVDRTLAKYATKILYSVR